MIFQVKISINPSRYPEPGLLLRLITYKYKESDIETAIISENRIHFMRMKNVFLFRKFIILYYSCFGLK